MQLIPKGGCLEETGRAWKFPTNCSYLLHRKGVHINPREQVTRIPLVSHKYATPFATLALVQNAGGAYTWDATFSLVITPSLPVPHN